VKKLVYERRTLSLRRKGNAQSREGVILGQPGMQKALIFLDKKKFSERWGRRMNFLIVKLTRRSDSERVLIVIKRL